MDITLLLPKLWSHRSYGPKLSRIGKMGEVSYARYELWFNAPVEINMLSWLVMGDGMEYGA